MNSVTSASPCTFLIHLWLLHSLRFGDCSFKLKRQKNSSQQQLCDSWPEFLRHPSKSFRLSPYTSPRPSDKRLLYYRSDRCSLESNKLLAANPATQKQVGLFTAGNCSFMITRKQQNTQKDDVTRSKFTFSLFSEKADAFRVFQHVTWYSTVQSSQQHIRMKPFIK